MDLFVCEVGNDYSVEALVAQAFGPNYAIRPLDVKHTRCPGPPLDGRETDWYEWSVSVAATARLGQLQAKPEAPEEWWGVLAIPDGTITAYVNGQSNSPERPRHRLAQGIVAFAARPENRPKPHPTNEIDEELRSLRVELEAALLAVEPLGRYESLTVAAARCWVSVQTGDSTVLVTPVDEGLQLGLVSEVYIDAAADSEFTPEDCAVEARSVTRQEIQPELEELGFVRDQGLAGTSEEDRHDGADVVGWNCTVADVRTAARILRSLRLVRTTIEQVAG